MTIKFDGIQGVIFNDDSVQATAQNSGPNLGTSQSYTSLGSITMNSWVQNTLAKPIYIIIQGRADNSASNTLYIEPTAASVPVQIAARSTIVDYGAAALLCGIVPPGHWWRVDGTQVTSAWRLA